MTYETVFNAIEILIPTRIGWKHSNHQQNELSPTILCLGCIMIRGSLPAMKHGNGKPLIAGNSPGILVIMGL